jgi:hypothetical protein
VAMSRPVSRPPEAVGLTCLPIATFPVRPRSVLPVLDNYGAVATEAGLPRPGQRFSVLIRPRSRAGWPWRTGRAPIDFPLSRARCKHLRTGNWRSLARAEGQHFSAENTGACYRRHCCATGRSALSYKTNPISPFVSVSLDSSSRWTLREIGIGAPECVSAGQRPKREIHVSCWLILPAFVASSCTGRILSDVMR